MTNDVRQWLAEIKTLQQKLSETRQERDEAYASAANWRNLYETEAKQRRVEANLAQQTIAALKAELQQLQTPIVPHHPEQNRPSLQLDVAHLQTLDELRERLMNALLECDRLTQALKAEQSHHEQTRRGLTTALGDTMELLNRERASHSQTDVAIAKASLEPHDMRH